MPDFHVADGPFSVPSSIIVNDQEYGVGQTVTLSDDEADDLRRKGFDIGEGAGGTPAPEQQLLGQPAGMATGQLPAQSPPPPPPGGTT